MSGFTVLDLESKQNLSVLVKCAIWIGCQVCLISRYIRMYSKNQALKYVWFHGMNRWSRCLMTVCTGGDAILPGGILHNYVRNPCNKLMYIIWEYCLKVSQTL